MSEATAGKEHWVTKQHASGPIRIYAWEKYLPSLRGQLRRHAPAGARLVDGLDAVLRPAGARPRRDLLADGLLRHGSGYDVWCFDCEGYGRSDKTRDTDFYVADGADDAEAVAEYIRELRGDDVTLLIYGLSSGALRAAMLAERQPGAGQAPGPRRLRLDRRGRPTLEQRRKRLPTCRSKPPPDRPRLRAHRSSRATTRAPPTTRSSRPSPRHLSSSTTRSRTAPTSTCATTCR